MQISRSDLLKRLLAVSPGLTSTGSTLQSTCVVFRKSRLYTLSREISCSILSGLDESITGAIQAKTLMSLLKKMNEEEIEINIENGKLIIKGKGRAAKLTMEAEIKMPLSFVELPKTWLPLASDFTQAVDLVHRCTRKKAAEFTKTCIHMHPAYLEASDNTKMARWEIETFVKQSVLVRGATLRVIVPLGVTKGAETDNWLHFRNPFGLRISIKKWPCEHFPNLSQFLEIRGETITFPKAISDATDRAGLMLDETDGSVKISISDAGGTVEGMGMAGEFSEEESVDYNGPPITFMVPPKLIGELVEQHTRCEITERTLAIRGESYTYMTSLESMP